ncbi:unnamed protein product [Schistocephalus solidus]|uniref:Reverse transcriptase n=1 Tax=Schistocephalus solidus TaxID=70667 RepID=A0A183SJK0_SCHSO|nr:unnamed protein product [Schistocephalus solidus]
MRPQPPASLPIGSVQLVYTGLRLVINERKVELQTNQKDINMYGQTLVGRIWPGHTGPQIRPISVSVSAVSHFLYGNLFFNTAWTRTLRVVVVLYVWRRKSHREDMHKFVRFPSTTSSDAYGVMRIDGII